MAAADPRGLEYYAGVGLVYVSICAPASMTLEQITAQVNLDHPTGIDSAWSLANEPFRNGEDSRNPHPCEIDHTRSHYLFSC
jgi:hypothetical protein